jgi:hypothetical protein
MPRMVSKPLGAADPFSSRDDGKIASVDSPPPLPLYHHPLVSGSLILIAGTVVQIGVWLMNMRLAAQAAEAESSVVVHGLLLDLVRSAWPGVEKPAVSPPIFAASLLLALSSGITWFAVARLGLGPRWGLWVGLCWVVHPSFAFIANKPDRLVLLIALLPTAWCLLLLWRRGGRIAVAMLFGVAAGLTCLAGFQGFVLLAVGTGGMMLSGSLTGRRRLIGVAMTPVGVAVSVVTVLAGLLAGQVAVDAASGRGSAASAGVIASRPADGKSLPPPSKTDWRASLRHLAAQPAGTRRSMRLRAVICLWCVGDNVAGALRQTAERVDTDLWNALDDGGDTTVAAAARRERSLATDRRPPAVQFLAEECRRAPRQAGRWFASRLWRSIYATGNGRFLYPLVLLQFAWLVPALWGYWIAIRYRPWRWLATTAGILAAAHWALVAIAEPVARNLTPIGGFAVLFALVGVTDVYERLFGRRLTAPAPASKPARLRRMQRNADLGNSP